MELFINYKVQQTHTGLLLKTITPYKEKLQTLANSLAHLSYDKLSITAVVQHARGLGFVVTNRKDMEYAAQYKGSTTCYLAYHPNSSLNYTSLLDSVLAQSLERNTACIADNPTSAQSLLSAICESWQANTYLAVVKHQHKDWEAALTQVLYTEETTLTQLNAELASKNYGITYVVDGDSVVTHASSYFPLYDLVKLANQVTQQGLTQVKFVFVMSSENWEVISENNDVSRLIILDARRFNETNLNCLLVAPDFTKRIYTYTTTETEGGSHD